MTESHFAAEPAIIQRLTDQVSGLVKIGSWSDLESAGVGAAATPAALVVYRGEDVPESLPSAAMVEQKWQVVLVVRAPATQLTHSEARAQAGTLVTDIIAAIHGWSPAPRHTPMAFSGGIDVRYGPGGEALFLIDFTVRRPSLSR